MSAGSYYLSGEALLPQVPFLRYQFFPHFSKIPIGQDIALAELADGVKGFDLNDWRQLNVCLDLLPYSLGAASLAMFDLARDQAAIVEAKSEKGDRSSIAELQSAERNLLGNRLDSFLDAGRKAQNAVIPYLRRKFPKLSLNPSLSKVADQLTDGKLGLPEPFKSDILDYWNNCGKLLKSYRDLGQHYLIVGTEAKVYTPREGNPGLLFCLPNNPDARAFADLRYDDPQVHVQPFVVEQFLKLHEFCYTLLEHLLDQQVTLLACIPAFGGRTTVGKGPAYVPCPIGQIEEIVRANLKELEGRFLRRQPSD